jgi:hypothetical protein
MKGLWIAPVLAMCMTGCAMTLPTTETKPPVPPPVTVKEVAVKQVVTVDQITDDNAKEMTQALNAELDQAQNGLVIGPEKPAETKAK